MFINFTSTIYRAEKDMCKVMLEYFVHYFEKNRTTSFINSELNNWENLFVSFMYTTRIELVSKGKLNLI